MKTTANAGYEKAKALMQADMQRLKSYFPFRIVWGAINVNDWTYETGATPTKRQVNDLMRKGYEGYSI